MRNCTHSESTLQPLPCKGAVKLNFGASSSWMQRKNDASLALVIWCVCCVGGSGCCQTLLECPESCQSSPNARRWFYPDIGRPETLCVQKCGWTVVDTIPGDGWVYQETRPRLPKMYHYQGGPLPSDLCPQEPVRHRQTAAIWPLTCYEHQSKWPDS